MIQARVFFLILFVAGFVAGLVWFISYLLSGKARVAGAIVENIHDEEERKADAKIKKIKTVVITKLPRKK